MYFVFDIGGTNMRVAVSADGETITKSKILPTSQDFEQGIQTLKQAANELSGGEKITGVAGGVAIILDKNKTMAVRSTHLKDWINKPLKATLERLFEAPAHIENDSHIAGLGEATHGAGVGKNIVAFINIGTGIGGVRIVNGKIDQNASGFEPGHQIIVVDGEPCDCGGVGHFESYVAGRYLEKMYHQKGENITDPAVWDKVSRYLAIALNNTVVHWSPNIIVLGGSVSKSIPLEKTLTYLKVYLTIFPELPQIVKATLGQDAGLYGALHLLTNN